MEFFWDFLGWAVTAQNLEGLFGSLNSENVALNHVCVWKMPGMGCGSVPKHGTEIVGILRDSPEIQWVWVGLTCVLNGCLVCIGPGMAVDFGFTK